MRRSSSGGAPASWRLAVEGAVALEFGAPGAGAEVELATLEGFDPLSSEAEVAGAIRLGLLQRRWVAASIDELLSAERGLLADELEAATRRPTAGARADLAASLSELALAADFAETHLQRAVLSMAHGYAVALTWDALPQRHALRQALTLAGHVLTEFCALGGQALLGDVVSQLCQAGDVQQGPGLDPKVLSAWAAGRGLHLQGARRDLPLAEEGFEVLGQLLGALLLLPPAHGPLVSVPALDELQHPWRGH